MQQVCFLVPGTTARFRCGGLAVELQTASLLGEIIDTEIVTYQQKQQDHPFLDDLLKKNDPERDILWVVSWGFDVPQLLNRLKGRLVAYHAHSSGYGFNLPAGVPVLAVSRNTLGYWGARAPRNPLFLVPNALQSQWLEHGDRLEPAARGGNRARSIDVLVQQRKSSRYVLEQLVPALQDKGFAVTVQSGWVDDLVALFNQSTVYLYDSADYWRGRGVSEGFGLPPLEAMACGCVVFSSFNHALADTLDPGLVGHQIGCISLANDVQRITAALLDPPAWLPAPNQLQALLNQYSETSLKIRWRDVLRRIDACKFDDQQLSSIPAWRLKAQSLISRSMNRWQRMLDS